MRHVRWLGMLVAALVVALGGCGDDDGGGGNGNDNGNVNADGVCGDGVVDPGESCDDGAENSDSAPNACRNNCRDPWCGDGVVDDALGEACDAGGDNGVSPSPCLEDCTVTVCGDGYLGGDEGCDDGADNSDTRSGACRTSCEPPRCGDGVFDPDRGEACDDGNVSEADTCTNACERRDGFVLNVGWATNVEQDLLHVAGSAAGTHLVAFRTGANQVATVVFWPDGSWSDGQAFNAAVVDPKLALDRGLGDGYVVAFDASLTGIINLQTVDASGAPGDTNTQAYGTRYLLQDLAVIPGGDHAVLYRHAPVVGSDELRVALHEANTDTLVASIGNLEANGQVGRAADGFLVVWNEAGVIHGRYLDAAGVAQTGSFVVDDTPTSLAQSDGAHLDSLSDGTTLVVWGAEGPDGTNEIRGRLYLPDRQPAGPSFALDTTTEGDAAHPDVAATADDTFCVVWQREHGSDRQVLTRSFAADGTPLAAGDEVIGEYTSPTVKAFPRAGANPRGVLVVWNNGVTEIRATFLPRVVP